MSLRENEQHLFRNQVPASRINQVRRCIHFSIHWFQLSRAPIETQSTQIKVTSMYRCIILHTRRNTISTISTLCAEESSWTVSAASTPTPSVSSASRTRTSPWPPQNRSLKFYLNPRLCCNLAINQEVVCQDPLIVLYHDILSQKEIRYMQSNLL